jgi:hypothetical protein
MGNGSGHPDDALKAETARPPRTSFPAQQRCVVRFQEYNHVRPHEALDDQTRASRYVPSVRTYVGLEEVDDGRWVVHFGPIEIGVLD